MSIGMRRLSLPTAERRIGVLDTFVAGLAARAAPDALEGLRAGAMVALRRGRPEEDRTRAGAVDRSTVEVCTADGRPLGLLPPEDARALEELAAADAPVSARVSGVVPAYRRPRVQLRIAFALA
jgi:hypothetical protein